MRKADPVARLVSAGVPENVADRAWAHLVTALRDVVEPVAVVLGGSFGAGLANRSSDIDFAVVVEQEPADRRVVTNAEVDGYSIEIVGMTAEEAAAVRDLFAAAARPLVGLKQATGALRTGSRRLVDLLQGHVLCGDEWVEQWRATVDPNVVAQALICAAAVYQGARHRDASGAILSADLLTAAESACMAFEAAAEATLARQHDFYESRKFLAARAARLDPSLAEAIARAKRRMATTPSVSDIDDVLRSAADLGASALVQWDAPPAASAGGPVRSARYCLASYDDGFLITGTKDHGVTRAVAEAWLAHDGRSDDEVLDVLAHRWRRAASDIAPFLDRVRADLVRAALVAAPA